MGRMFLLIIDAYSKCLEVYRTSSTTIERTIDVFRDVFARFGIQEVLVLDNGPSPFKKKWQDSFYQWE